jgi:hypothetical protein
MPPVAPAAPATPSRASAALTSTWSRTTVPPSCARTPYAEPVASSGLPWIDTSWKVAGAELGTFQTSTPSGEPAIVVTSESDRCQVLGS